MKRDNWNHLVERKVGDKTLIVDIKKNAIYEVDEATAECIALIRSNGGVVDYDMLQRCTGKPIETLKEDVRDLVEVLGDGIHG